MNEGERQIIVASITGPKGETGMHTHIREVLGALKGMNLSALMVNPYDAPPWQVYPLFSLRKALAPFSNEVSVRWYCYWHERMLRKALRPLLRDRPNAIVYAQCPLSAHAALAVRYSPSQAVVMAVHFNVSEAEEWACKGLIARGGMAERAMLAIDSTILPRLDGLIFVSEYMRNQLTTRIPQLAAVPQIVLPNFISAPSATSAPVKRDLINIGTLEPRKNQSYLLQIVAAARAQGNPLRLTLVGDGPDRERLQQQARRLNIADLVHFAGYVKQGASLLTTHKAYIHTATMENLPFTLIEALAHGLPVFAPAVGGIPEIFRDGVEGRMLPLNDEKAAARRLTEWMTVPERLADASAAARERFHAHFHTNKVAARLPVFFNEVSASAAVAYYPFLEHALPRQG
jgi:glycosyltransferase involved in cell wall biosynthesis